MYDCSRGQGREVHWARGIRSCLFWSHQRKCSQPFSQECHALPRTYGTHAAIRNACLEGREQNLPALPGSTSGSPASSPAFTQGNSPFFLLTSTGAIIVIPSTPYSHPCTSGGRAATLHYFCQTGTQKVSPQRGDIHPWMPRKTHQWMRISPQIHRRNHQTPRKGGQLIGLPPWGPNVWMPLAGIQISWRRQEPVISQLTPGIGFTVIQKICPTYSRDLPKKLTYWASLFSKSNGCGKGQSIWDKLTTFFRLSPRGWNS